MRYLITFVFFLQSFSGTAQPWITQVADLCPANDCTPQFSPMTVCYSRLYFTADMGLGGRAYVTKDGTSSGTYMLNPAEANWNTSNQFVEYNGQVMCIGGGTSGWELFLADPQSANVQPVFAPGTSPVWGSISDLTVYNGKVFFGAGNNSQGMELWATDGTDTGTYMVKDIVPGAAGSALGDLVVMNNKLYFVANDVVYGRELWVSDGTDTGTHMVPQLTTGTTGSSPRELTVMNNRLYYGCHMPGGWGLCSSDGTAAGTIPVKLGIGLPTNMITDAGRLYFSAANNSASELYVSDGTALGTYMPKKINQNGDPTPLDKPVAYNGLIYFAEKFNGIKYLWQTDGTNMGTVIVKGLFQNPRWMTAYCGKLYFVAQNNWTGNPQIWMYDGDTVMRITPTIDPPHTLRADAIPPGIIGLKEFNGSLYYPADYDNTNVELWKLTDFPLSIAQTGWVEFQLSPNPVHDRLSIQWAEEEQGTIKIYDMQGRLMQRQPITEQHTSIDVQLLPPGIYMVQVHSSHGTGIQKLVKN